MYNQTKLNSAMTSRIEWMTSRNEYASKICSIMTKLYKFSSYVILGRETYERVTRNGIFFTHGIKLTVKFYTHRINVSMKSKPLLGRRRVYNLL